MTAPSHLDGKSLARAIEEVRRKLIDTTFRNPLLAFPKSKTALWVIEEVPDQLWQQLADGEEMELAPVPEPRGELLAQLDAGATVREIVAQRRRRGSRVTLPIEQGAERAGLNPSFDLSLKALSPAAPSHHRDGKIQVRHYPDEMERIATRLEKEAKIALQETGSNLLQMSFGFLEWTDVDGGQQRHAPLLLLPIQIKRTLDKRRSAYRFSVQTADEDPEANIALREKLREFNIEMPDRQENETPASYLYRVQEVIAQKPEKEWRVSGRVGISLLQFGKMFMYRDLDPRTWVVGDRQVDPPVCHPLVQQLFAARDGGAADPRALGEYDFNDEKVEEAAPPIIYDADSSQHAAICDVLSGKNIVIQGPPGTGKSQTITNLLAGALREGKSVLFVAEKRAALEVVHKRLAAARLTPFVLELHSDKAKKKDIAAHLQLRLQGDWEVPPAVSGTTRSDHARERTKLARYARIMASLAGTSGLRVHEVFWYAVQARQLLGENADRFAVIELPEAARWTPAEVSERRAVLADLARGWRVVIAAAPDGSRHPWQGLDPTRVLPTDEPVIRHALEQVAAAEGPLARARARYEELVGTAAPETTDELARLERLAEQLAVIPVPDLGNVFAQLTTTTAMARLAAFRDALASLQTVKAQLDLDWPVRGSAAARASLGSALAEACSDTEHGDTCAVLEARARACREAVIAMRVADEALLHFSARFRIGHGPVSWADAQAVRAVLQDAVSCPASAASLRSPALTSPRALEQLEVLAQTQTKLAREAAGLEGRLRLSLAPSHGHLKTHVVTLASTSWWGRLRGAYRRARAAHRAMLRDGRANHARALDDMVAVLEHEEGKERWTREASQLLGSHFHGLDTPVSSHCQLARWYRALQGDAAAHPAHGAAILALWGLEDGKLVELAALATAGEVSATLERAGESAALSLSTPPQSGTTLLTSTTTTLAARAERLEAAVQAWSAALLPDTVPLPEGLELLEKARRLDEGLARMSSDQESTTLLGSALQGVATDIDAVTRTLAASTALRHVLGEGHPLDAWLHAPDFAHRRDDLLRAVAAMRSTAEGLFEPETALLGVMHTSHSAWHDDGASADARPWADVIRRSALAASAPAALAPWIGYGRTRGRALALGLGRLAVALEEGVGAPAHIPVALEFLVATAHVRAAFQTHADLLDLQGTDLTQARTRFAELDQQLLELNRWEISSTARLRPVPQGTGVGPVGMHTGRALVWREAHKLRAHIAVRDLVLRAGDALQALCPIWMMSPLSVARFCPPGAVTFDLVVMDEASQVRPEDALGAVARGGQLVVVGDQHQLPPSTFFNAAGDESDDDTPDDEDLAQGVNEAESILDLARNALPERMLTWHYRSRHESLIAFSNERWYERRLVVFPSPQLAGGPLGVRFVHASRGVYGGSLNPREAEMVVDLVREHARTRPATSLGVVAMNRQQADLIQDLLDQARKGDVDLQAFHDKWEAADDGLNALFVKNLENVQGDERDAILISVTYGPDSAGNVYQRFGPLNGEAGPRRLNVLFTRAREQVVLVSSMRSADLPTTETTALGTQVLKGYLEFAETGRLPQVSLSGREPDSPFEVEVGALLRRHGFTVRAQLGVAGYFLDLAVVHPDRPGAYLCAIECDGATYHSARSARDRDRLREQQLRALGWKIHRIWSTDWFREQSVEGARLLQRLEQWRGEP